MLAGVKYIKLRFTSRNLQKENEKYVLLGISKHKTAEFAKQINLNLSNW